MLKLFKRHYQAIVDRGLITKETETDDFLIKLEEEFIELCEEPGRELFIQEAIDCLCVITNMLQHLEVDIEKELLQNVIRQEARGNHVQKILKYRIET